MNTSSKKIKSDGFTIVASKTDNSESAFTVTDDSTGASINIPGRFFPILYDQGKNAYDALMEKKLAYEFNAHHPLKTNKKSLKAATEAKRGLLPIKGNIRIEGTPVLEWVEGTDAVGRYFADEPEDFSVR